MSHKFGEEIVRLETELQQAEETRVTFEELLEFSRSMLVDIASAWKAADVDQKQRVQNNLFPSGLEYHPEKGILNSGNNCLFNELEDFVTGKVSLARPERFELPT